jgi:hypothetical protein
MIEDLSTSNTIWSWDEDVRLFGDISQQFSWSIYSIQTMLLREFMHILLQWLALVMGSASLESAPT